MYTFVTWNEEISEDTPQTIQGEALSSFLEVFFKQAQYFSLKTAEWTQCHKSEVREALKPYIVKQFITQKWFGYDLSQAPSSAKNTIEIQLYKATPEAKDILLSYFADIFFNEVSKNALSESTQDLEDLCFFTSSQLLLGTVSHANLLKIFSNEQSMGTKLESYGKWIFRDDDSTNDEYLDILS